MFNDHYADTCQLNDEETTLLQFLLHLKSKVFTAYTYWSNKLSYILSCTRPVFYLIIYIFKCCSRLLMMVICTCGENWE